MRCAYPYLEAKDSLIRHANEQIKLLPVKSIEEHSSGINQMISINNKDLVTVSDDCTIKFWSSTNLKVDTTLQTETVTCITATGKHKEYIIAGSHSGNIICIKSYTREKKGINNEAH